MSINSNNEGAHTPESEPKVSTVSENLEVPWALVHLTNNSLLVAERKRTIRQIEKGGK